MQIPVDRIATLFGRFPQLKATLHTLNSTGITYAIGGSGCLFLLGNERLPDDVDIYLTNDQHDKADAMFRIKPFLYKSEHENVRNSNPGDGHALQLTSALKLTVSGKEYDLSLTPVVLAARLKTEFDGETIWLYPPEDVLIIKALLQRGPDVGKHDIEDIRDFLKNHDGMRQEYLKQRITDIGAEGRVAGIFREIGQPVA